MTRSIVVAALVLCPIVINAQVPGPQPSSIEGAVPHVYKSVGGVDLKLHVFNPEGHTAESAAAAIVLFFGGGWASGTVRQFAPQARHFAARGMVAIVADYRVSSRHKTTPSKRSPMRGRQSAGSDPMRGNWVSIPIDWPLVADRPAAIWR